MVKAQLYADTFDHGAPKHHYQIRAAMRLLA